MAPYWSIFKVMQKPPIQRYNILYFKQTLDNNLRNIYEKGFKRIAIED
jgi:hypothetical protein